MTQLERLSATLRRRGRRTWLVGLIVVLIAGYVVTLVALAPHPTGRELRLDELGSLSGARQVAGAQLLDRDKVVELRLRDGSRAWAAYPVSDAATARLLVTLDSAGAQVAVRPQSGKALVGTVATYLAPLLVLAALLALILTAKTGGGSDEIAAFGTVSGRRGSPTEPPATRFGDVAGNPEAVEELAEVVAYLRDPARYARLQAKPPKGVLLFGPPGTGKTLMARAVAGEAGVPFFAVAGAEFVESLVGIGAARVRDLFARVRAQAPAILFIDEIDAVGRRRGGEGGGSDEREQTLNQLLVELDGFDAAPGVVVMAATNRPDVLDPALLRPGRFDRHVTLEPPDAPGREAILRLHAAHRPLGADVDLAGLARRTPGFTGADLEGVVNEAALLTVRSDAPTLTAAHFDEAVERLLHGPQRRGHVLDATERRLAAVHEAGHAVTLVALGLADVEGLHRVTILPRGRRPAGTSGGGEGDRVLLGERRLRARLVALSAGAAAEELVLGERSTGSDGDLERATMLAREMVARHGMSDRVGPVRLLASDARDYVGDGPALLTLAPSTHDVFDSEVRRLLDEAGEAAQELLGSRRDAVDALVGALLTHETLERAALAPLLDPLLPSDHES